MTTHRFSDARVLLYSHDSFGLGHLRRCRAIAHALVERYKGLSVLILSGSPLVSSFDYRARVDFVRVPGVIKLHNGEYTSLKLHIDIEQTLRMRESIIHHTARIFEPNVFIVDKEPMGLRGEVENTLKLVKEIGGFNILGLRDVMDDPESLDREWRRKQVAQPMLKYYDQIWVYGAELMGNPLNNVTCVRALKDRVRFTGYIERDVPQDVDEPYWLRDFPDYLLVTAGGGGDGEVMIDWVLRAYEACAAELMPAVIVCGPFMAAAARQDFERRAARIGKIKLTTFERHMEFLVERATGVVAMGGYNTFCEILSFGKPALILPRSEPRREQEIRARRAEELGLLSVVPLEEGASAQTMVAALKTLARARAAESAKRRGLLTGLGRICEFMDELLPESSLQSDEVPAGRSAGGDVAVL